MKTLALYKVAILGFALAGLCFGLLYFINPTLFRRDDGSKSISWFSAVIAATTTLVTLFSFFAAHQQSRVSREEAIKSDTILVSKETAAPQGEASTKPVQPSLPVSFSSQYVVYTKPDPRVWIQAADDSWLETYDGQTSNIFSLEEKLIYQGCESALLAKRGEPQFEVLIPTLGCSSDLKFRWKDGPWQQLGLITNVSMSVPSSTP